MQPFRNCFILLSAMCQMMSDERQFCAWALSCSVSQSSARALCPSSASPTTLMSAMAQPWLSAFPAVALVCILSFEGLAHNPGCPDMVEAFARKLHLSLRIRYGSIDLMNTPPNSA